MELLVQRTNDSRVDVTFALSLYFAEELLFSVMLNYLCWPYQITLILQSAAIQDMALFISWPMVVKKKTQQEGMIMVVCVLQLINIQYRMMSVLLASLHSI